MTRQLLSQFRSADRDQNEQLLLENYGQDNLADLLADMDRVMPNTLAADVEEQLGRLITFLKDRAPQKGR